MRLHNPQITGSLTVSGSSNVDFTSATKGVSGSFRASDIKSALLLILLVHLLNLL